jgi:NAD(P)-dependent dehydrogenase (short-subunit alcohol dehydrogenase family)
MASSSPESVANSRQVAVVTGATQGIGKAVARSLARSGFRTVVVGRGVDRIEHTAREIASETGNPEVDPIAVVDLAERAEVRRLSEALRARYPAVHLLVNNAGAIFFERLVTSDGLERTFALNVLAPFALTSGLLDRLRAGAPSRVVDVSSAAHLGQHVDFSDLQSIRGYRGFTAYGRSKLELILLTREFARRLAGSGVVVNAVHPGFIRSGFGNNNPGGAGWGVRVGKFLFARSLGYGMRNVMYVATDPAAGTVSGEYFSRERVARTSPDAADMASALRLFEVCQGLAGSEALAAPNASEARPAAPAVPSGQPRTA